jgi:processive 1,2-diacylglycerol beta-glucosyltransferase
MRRVLILTAGFGEGHNAAARGLKEGFDSLGGEVEAEVLDLFEPAFGAFYQKSRRHYLWMVNHAPELWAAIYAVLDRVPLLSLLSWFFRPLKNALVRALMKSRPDAVVSVYPVYGYVLDEAKREAALPALKSFVMITDSITVNSVWLRCGADAFCVANEDTAEVLFAARIPREKVRVSGFPVSMRFATSMVEREELFLGGRLPRVLFMVNGQRERALLLVERLLRQGGIELTVTVGKDGELGRRITELAGRIGREVRVLGWVENVPDLIRMNHLLIGKAGGAMVQEALAAEVPMLITQILPGQEEGNARLILQNGCGAFCPTNEVVASAVERVFADGAAVWFQMHRHVLALSRPAAAEEGARWIESRLGAVDVARPAGPQGVFGVRALD